MVWYLVRTLAAPATPLTRHADARGIFAYEASPYLAEFSPNLWSFPEMHLG